MHEHKNQVHVPVMVGVGAAFDMLSDRKKQAPPWMREQERVFFSLIAGAVALVAEIADLRDAVHCLPSPREPRLEEIPASRKSQQLLTSTLIAKILQQHQLCG